MVSVNRKNETLERIQVLREHLDYNADTGFFRRRIRTNNRCENGWFKGCENSDGYLQVRVSMGLHKAHRIAWAIHYGEWPDGQIDHINGDKSDNRIVNLRDVTPRQNSRNSKLQKNSSSGVNGVRFDKKSGKWKAHIRVDEGTKHLGYFVRFEDAVAARKEADAIYGFHPNHGRSS